jgi:hypothetical protein
MMSCECNLLNLFVFLLTEKKKEMSQEHPTSDADSKTTDLGAHPVQEEDHTEDGSAQTSPLYGESWFMRRLDMLNGRIFRIPRHGEPSIINIDTIIVPYSPEDHRETGLSVPVMFPSSLTRSVL